VYVKVRSVVVGWVGVCMLCTSVSEFYRDYGEGTVLQEVVWLSYSRKCISLVVESDRG